MSCSECSELTTTGWQTTSVAEWRLAGTRTGGDVKCIRHSYPSRSLLCNNQNNYIKSSKLWCIYTLNASQPHGDLIVWNKIWPLQHYCRCAIVSIFGKIGRIASEEVIFAPIKSKCLPILLYGSDSCPTNAAVKHSFEFTLNRVRFKIFGALPKDTYRDICKYFGVDHIYRGTDFCSSE